MPKRDTHLLECSQSRKKSSSRLSQKGNTMTGLSAQSWAQERFRRRQGAGSRRNRIRIFRRSCRRRNRFRSNITNWICTWQTTLRSADKKTSRRPLLAKAGSAWRLVFSRNRHAMISSAWRLALSQRSQILLMRCRNSQGISTLPPSSEPV